MSSEKDLAIVLRVTEFSETSCVVLVFTRQFGKLSALAKGARRPKSPFEAALDVLAVCRIVFLHKSGDLLDLLTEARLERRFRSARSDLTRLYAGYYVAELLDGLTDARDPHPKLFDEADSALRGLDQGADVGVVVLRFEMAALHQLGHLPLLSECAACGGSVDSAERVAFGLLAGGLLCGRCRAGQRQVIAVRRETIDTLRAFSGDEQRPGQADDIPQLVRGELRGLVNQYIAHLLGHRPKLHAYLGELTR